MNGRACRSASKSASPRGWQHVVSRAWRRPGAMLVAALLAGIVAPSIGHAKDDAPANALSSADIREGWIRLFDGATQFGWKANSDTPWQVTDGCLVAGEGTPGLLLTTTPFADFELRCDCWLDQGGNSGIFLRTGFEPRDPARDCYELNLCDTHPHYPTGSLVGRAKPDAPSPGEGRWRTFHVTAVGPRFEIDLDDKRVLTWTDPSEAARASGFIGLQKKAGKIMFRNIYLRPLAIEPLFNGQDITGWHIVPGGASEFSVKDGAIAVRDGRGFLETDRVFADFILQADVRTNGEHLNSGIFFRAMKGTATAPSNGYECQIHNAFKNGDRTLPVDFGTGGIYRRVPARRVVSNDREWCSMTLAASGAHIAVWVNGEQVTDWSDTRPPNQNPREGLRLEAGHISLQGHDPTTDLSFRDLRIEVLPPETPSR